MPGHQQSSAEILSREMMHDDGKTWGVGDYKTGLLEEEYAWNEHRE
jgi:hypothetical protein